MKKPLLLIAIIVTLLSSASYAQSWSLTGNSGTTPTTNFVGTKDNQSLVFKTNNTERMRILSNGRIGIGVTNPVQKLDVNGSINISQGSSFYIDNHKFISVDLSKQNIFLGTGAGTLSISGSSNISAGNNALYSITSGNSNTALGNAALFSNSTASYNTAIGYTALYNNTTGYYLTATGTQALYNNTSGIFNTATGTYSLYSNTTGNNNTANGNYALYFNSTGNTNSAMGYKSLYSNTTGDENTSYGSTALLVNNTGGRNVAIGSNTLGSTVASSGNTAVGYNAGSIRNNGFYNTFIGSETDAFYSDLYNTTALGHAALVFAPNQVRIGNSLITSIGGFANWTNVSDGRVKKNIKENVPGLLFINRLKPVTYNLDLDAADRIAGNVSTNGKDPSTTDSLRKGKTLANQTTQMDMEARKAKMQVIYSGFVAQDVEKVAKDLNYDFSGVDAAKSENDLYGLRYSEFVVPLVKAVQELSKENNELKSRVEKLEALMNTQPSTATHQQSANGNQAVKLRSTTGVLEQNMPNPFNHTTTINYILPQQFSTAKIIINDNTGRSLKEIKVSGTGKNNLSMDATTLSSGTYQYSLIIDGKLIATKQMMLAK